MDHLLHRINPLRHIDYSQHNADRNVAESKLFEVVRILRNSDDLDRHKQEALYVVVVVVFRISSIFFHNIPIPQH